MNLSRALAIVLMMPLNSVVGEVDSFASRQDLPAESVTSGYEFLAPETQAMQDDEFANPGYLWVAQGKQLFVKEAGNGSCRSCHSANLEGVAARYPRYDVAAGQLRNLASRANVCRVEQQGLNALEDESDELLSLTAYIASQSEGQPYEVTTDGPATPYFEQGRAYFFMRKGQLNLACNQCHDDNWGGMLRGDRISQGHPNAYPGYRLEWQALGSLHRRMQDCDVGVRAKPHEPGSEIYTSLELYLKWRARELPIEAPGVRR